MTTATSKQTTTTPSRPSKLRPAPPAETQQLAEGLQLTWLNPQDLVEDPQNERGMLNKETDPELLELAQSISNQGLIEPLRAFRHPQSGLKIIQSGHRRRLAAIIAGVSPVPVVLGPPPRDLVDQALTRLTANLQRRDLTPIQKAHALRSLLDADPTLTQTELGRCLGKTQSAIANTLRLLDLPQSVQALLNAGKLTTGHGIALLAVEHPALNWDGNVEAPKEEVIIELAQSAADNQQSVAHLANSVENHNRSYKQRQDYAESQRRNKEAQATAAAERAAQQGKSIEAAKAEEEAREQKRQADYTRAQARRTVADCAIVDELAASLESSDAPTLTHLKLAATILANGYYYWSSERALAFGITKAETFQKQVDKCEDRSELLILIARIALARGVPYAASDNKGNIVGAQSDTISQWVSKAFELPAAIHAALEEAGLL